MNFVLIFINLSTCPHTFLFIYQCVVETRSNQQGYRDTSSRKYKSSRLELNPSLDPRSCMPLILVQPFASMKNFLETRRDFCEIRTKPSGFFSRYWTKRQCYDSSKRLFWALRRFPTRFSICLTFFCDPGNKFHVNILRTSIAASFLRQENDAQRLFI